MGKAHKAGQAKANMHVRVAIERLGWMSHNYTPVGAADLSCMRRRRTSAPKRPSTAKRECPFCHPWHLGLQPIPNRFPSSLCFREHLARPPDSSVPETFQQFDKAQRWCLPTSRSPAQIPKLSSPPSRSQAIAPSPFLRTRPTRPPRGRRGLWTHVRTGPRCLSIPNMFGCVRFVFVLLPPCPCWACLGTAGRICTGMCHQVACSPQSLRIVLRAGSARKTGRPLSSRLWESQPCLSSLQG
mmetsp:Transcript_17969/g.49881  ORF Transcript_17969/g.49881 Transcript_17969/m.49881 type:complete len:241 (-) Transcript_17969:1867-2589(-)